MRSYSQPEGEQVSDAQDGQEGKSEIPPLKEKKKMNERKKDGGAGGEDEKAR